LLTQLDLAIPDGRNTQRFEAERVFIEPFDLRQPCEYDVVIDRLTHWYHTSREWIKKAILTDGYGPELLADLGALSVAEHRAHRRRLQLACTEGWAAPSEPP
jgi:hypothetical protein